jgi:hypothetical protein
MCAWKYRTYPHETTAITLISQTKSNVSQTNPPWTHEIFFLLSLYNRPAVSTNASHQFDKKSHPFTITSHGNQKKANTCSSYRTQPSTLNKLKAELFFLSALLDIHIKGYILLYKQRKLQGIRPMGLAQTGRDSCRAPPLN